MKKLFLILLSVLLIFSCKFNDSDPDDSFLHKDYSSLIKENQYVIPSDTDAITVFNLFYNEYGYGEFSVQGEAIHTETANVLGEKITKTITCQINKVKIFHNSDIKSINDFYVELYNENNEKLQYLYEWQCHIDNIWKNEKYSLWLSSSDWYNKADAKNRTDWDIVINR